jgi:alpha-galactosidase
MKGILVIVALFLAPSLLKAQGGSGLEPYPYGGQGNNLNYLSFTETTIRAYIDADVSNGVVSTFGSTFNFGTVNWENGRSGTSPYHIIQNTADYPDGYKAGICDYAHSNGAECWIYDCIGSGSCPSVSSTGYESVDCGDFASWGVDRVYIDGPNATQANFDALMSACRAASSTMLMTVSTDASGGLGSYGPSGWCPTYGGTEVYTPGPDYSADYTFSSLATLMDAVTGVTTTGCWTQPGGLMLDDPSISGAGGHLSLTEAQTAVAWQAIIASPIGFAIDPTNGTNSSRIAFLTNAEVIQGCDLDALGVQGSRISGGACVGGNTNVWAKPVSGGSYCVAFFNCSGSTANISATWSSLPGSPLSSYTGRDIINHTNLGTLTSGYTASSVPSHGVTMLKLSPSSSPSGPASARGGSAVSGGNAVSE